MDNDDIVKLVMSVSEQMQETALQSMVLRNLLIVMCNSLSDEQRTRIRQQMKQIHQVTDGHSRQTDKEMMVSTRREVEIILEMIR